MKELAPPIQRYLHRLTMRERKPAYLCADRQGRLCDWGGALKSYGIAGLKKGKEIGQQVYFLEGLIPLDCPQFLVPCVETESEVFLDIHLFRVGDRDWALLLDATEEADQRRQLLQSSPEPLSPQAGGSPRGAFWAEELGRSFAPRPRETDDPARRATVVFAGFEASAASPGGARPGGGLRTGVPEALRELKERADMFVTADGEVAIAVFEGASNADSERCAVEAALSVMRSTQKTAGKASPARVGIAMASGPQSELREMISFAARLQNEAACGEILIDPETFGALSGLQTLFAEVQLQPGSQGKQAFSHLLRPPRGQS